MRSVQDWDEVKQDQDIMKKRKEHQNGKMEMQEKQKYFLSEKKEILSHETPHPWTHESF